MKIVMCAEHSLSIHCWRYGASSFMEMFWAHRTSDMFWDRISGGLVCFGRYSSLMQSFTTLSKKVFAFWTLISSISIPVVPLNPGNCTMACISGLGKVEQTKSHWSWMAPNPHENIPQSMSTVGVSHLPLDNIFFMATCVGNYCYPTSEPHSLLQA